ncbi:tRNA (guanine(10)-N2)-methyltransferase homolog [Phlebotomus argentipes]|uniref:tRNA (guanine(10)-N2)-methyltransferase homolog n=1 Tax=Phlebotomus argentipes TaxID=94469 RepID=UPI002893625C|nr:tRNA (guanine(10)-N2)-methyltransferase homolog [Phlebotomus argentipes]
MSKNLKKYILWFAQEHVNFRYPEIQSIFKLFNICPNLKKPECPEHPFWVVDLPDEESARKIASRSVSLRCILELWAHATSVPVMHKNVQSLIEQNPQWKETIFHKNSSFKITVETYNKHISQAEKLQKIETFQYIPTSGEVNLKNPDVQFMYFEFYGLDPTNVPAEPDNAFFGRWIADGRRSDLKELSLKRRKFIGNTSMDPQLSTLMANQALTREGDLILDPFVGTGSLLVNAAKFGAFVLGTDIDFLMLHARTRPSRIRQKEREKDESVRANLMQYGCQDKYLDVCVADFSLPIWNSHLRLDAIITDPPYGIREATAKVAPKEASEKRTPSPPPPGVFHCPSRSRYDLKDIFRDLLTFGARHLKLGGRLVCWLPVIRDEYTDSVLPSHPCMALLANSEQILSKFSARRLLTFEKITEGCDAADGESSGAQVDFRHKYFSHGEETREERRLQRAQLRQIGREEAAKRRKEAQ